MNKNKDMKGRKESRMVSFQGKLECRDAQEDAPRVISGYAAVFNQQAEIGRWYRYKEQIASDAFEGCNYDKCVACFNHNTDNILARYASGTLKLSVEEVGLRFEFEVPNTTVGNDMYELVKRGDISQCSFAFVVEEDTWRYSEDMDGVDERTINKISELWDVSLVTYPAYEGTSVDARSAEEDKLAERKKEYLSKFGKSNIKAECESRARICQVLGLGNAN
jgi:HK97 family phage prohead protease